MLLYVIFGINLYPPLDIKSMIKDLPSSTRGMIEGIIATLLGLGLFAYIGPHNLIRFKRRLSARLYILSGRPLASVEGKQTFDPDSECGYNGIEVGEYYFDLNTDFWLDRDIDLGKLDNASGEMCIWYIPTGLRDYKNSRTGKVVKHNCVLVRAEWRPRV